MSYILFILFLLFVIISLDLGLSIAVAYAITWLFVGVSFEIALVVAAICSAFSIYLLAKVIIYSMEHEAFEKNEIYIDDEYDDIVDDLDELKNYQSSKPVSQRKKRTKRKR